MSKVLAKIINSILVITLLIPNITTNAIEVEKTTQEAVETEISTELIAEETNDDVLNHDEAKEVEASSELSNEETSTNLTNNDDEAFSENEVKEDDISSDLTKEDIEEEVSNDGESGNESAESTLESVPENETVSSENIAEESFSDSEVDSVDTDSTVEDVTEELLSDTTDVYESSSDVDKVEDVSTDLTVEDVTEDVLSETTDINENSSDIEEVENVSTDMILDDVIEGDLSITEEESIIEENDIEALIYEDYEVEVIKVETPIQTYSVMDEYQRQESEIMEFQMMAEEKETYTRLVNKTDSEYELAIANADGSYTFVDGLDTMEDALNELESIPTESMRSDSMPVIINSDGQVVYSTYSMARVWKHINGKPYNSNNRNTNLYSDAALKYSDNYINHGYVSDLPIISFNGTTSAKVMVSGYEGWINMNTKASEYDILVYPVNQITNPTHYYVKSGVLYHFIASNPLSPGSGYAIEIGNSPSYLKEGVRYYSYDGNYFYTGSTNSEGLTKLLIDYRAGTRANALNANNPYYNYYQTLPFRSETVYTAAELNSFINAKTTSVSKLRNTGAALKEAEAKYGVNALLALGIAINESGWGTSSIAQSKNNIFGLNAVDSNPALAANEFSSVAACIYDFAKNWISGGYADPTDWRYNGGFVGNKNLGANVRYASDPYWAEKAARYAFQADLYLSGSVTNLKDTDTNQIGLFTSTGAVMNSSGGTIYNVELIGTPVVIASESTVYINGKECYRVYPERTLPVSSGTYNGNYNWEYLGYVPVSSVKLVNDGKGITTLSVLGGANRFETAVALSKSEFTNSSTVVIVNYNAIIDGIAASALATAAEAPILLATKSTIPSSIEAEIKRLGAKNAIFIGGTGVLDSTLEAKFKNMGLNVTRVGGINRYSTALEVAKYIDRNYYDVNQVFVVSGYGEADALSAGAISGQIKAPIILSGKSGVNSEIESWLRGERLVDGYIIGGTGVLDNNALNQLNSMTEKNISGNRLGGANRYETNAQIIDRFYGDTVESVYITKGLVLADALTAGPIAARSGSPIVIANSGLTTSQVNVLSGISSREVIQAGLGVDKSAVEKLLTILK